MKLIPGLGKLFSFTSVDYSQKGSNTFNSFQYASEGIHAFAILGEVNKFYQLRIE